MVGRPKQSRPQSLLGGAPHSQHPTGWEAQHCLEEAELRWAAPSPGAPPHSLAGAWGGAGPVIWFLQLLGQSSGGGGGVRSVGGGD